jgi:hypothetical protein
VTLSLSSSIVLGTAQFGVPYGRRRGQEPLSADWVTAILEEAWGVGIRAFDTALDYGCAPSRLGKWLGAQGRAAESDVTTKVPSDRPDRERVLLALEPFGAVGTLTVLTHGPATSEKFAVLRALGDEIGFTPGQSVYDTADVHAAARAGARRVQSRFSVLNTCQLETAQRNSAPFDGRSVYLQGVLLDSPSLAASRAPGIERLVSLVQTAALECGLPLASALVAGALAHLRGRDRIVLGVDSPAQVEAVSMALTLSPGKVAGFLSALAPARALARSQPYLIDPRTWSPAV